MSLLIRPSRRSGDDSPQSRKRKIGSNVPIKAHGATSSGINDTILLDDSPPSTSNHDENSPLSPSNLNRSNSPDLFSPSSGRADPNETVDLFDTTAESPSKVVVLSSPESARSPLKVKNPPKALSSGFTTKQASMDKFVMQNYSKSSSVSRKRCQQSKMDLFVKWKDPTRLERADKARNKFFNNVEAEDIHNSSWTVPQEEIDKKFEEIRSPAKKRAPKKKKSPSKSPMMSPKKKKLKAKQVAEEEIDGDAELEEHMKERRELMKKIMDEQKKKSKGSSLMTKVQQEQRVHLKEGQVIRKQADRQRMHGSDCPCCKDYYDALGLSPTSREKRVQQSSRHRFVEMPKPKTPDHYWDLRFPSSSEKKRQRTAASNSVKKTSASKKLF